MEARGLNNPQKKKTRVKDTLVVGGDQHTCLNMDDLQKEDLLDDHPDFIHPLNEARLTGKPNRKKKKTKIKRKKKWKTKKENKKKEKKTKKKRGRRRRRK